MVRNIRLILCVTILCIVTGILMIIIYKKIKEGNAAFEEECVLENELKTYKNLKRLLVTQGISKYDKNVKKSVIFKQSFINAVETGNSSYIFPIPLHEKRQTVIFSSWRCGSTFLGDIINAIPGTYYHYEPFDFYKAHQLETNQINIDYVKNLLKCQYQNAIENMLYATHWSFNTRLAQYCPSRNYASFCEDISFRNKFCNIFPRQSMKLVRSRFTLAEHLLSDPDFNLNVILLVRDPRGVSVSRRKLVNCTLYPDCYSMKRYCNYLVEDYKTAKILLEKYTTRIKIIRFEDLATNPFDVTKEMFEQFGMKFDKNIQEFLKKHTNKEKGSRFSTFRNSKAVVSKWMKKMKINEIKKIQESCVEAMKIWGYNFVQNMAELKSQNFDPFDDFSM